MMKLKKYINTSQRVKKNAQDKDIHISIEQKIYTLFKVKAQSKS